MYTYCGILVFTPRIRPKINHRRSKDLNIGGGGGGARFRIFVRGGRGARGSQIFFTFLTLNSDNIVKLKTELKSILLEIPSNKINVQVHILNWYFCDLGFAVSHRH